MIIIGYLIDCKLLKNATYAWKEQNTYENEHFWISHFKSLLGFHFRSHSFLWSSIVVLLLESSHYWRARSSTMIRFLWRSCIAISKVNSTLEQFIELLLLFIFCLTLSLEKCLIHIVSDSKETNWKCWLVSNPIEQKGETFLDRECTHFSFCYCLLRLDSIFLG